MYFAGALSACPGHPQQLPAMRYSLQACVCPHLTTQSVLAAVKHCGDRVVISCAKCCFHNWSSTAFCPCYSSVCGTPIFVCGSSPSRSQWAFLSSACLAVSLLWLRNLYLLVNNNFLLLMIEECCQRNDLWTVAFCVWTSPLGPPLLHSHFPWIFCTWSVTVEKMGTANQIQMCVHEILVNLLPKNISAS